ncbi:DUF4153 domain-containing protein [Mucilaginibacter terrenus]|uniref:DUF4153 domain-containing protein n=1 Tax=Mucilaginibacter terrenus TaxID=2482727 RepID=A0A3E2NPC5_9SPHI|nr:DUF4153 domain-containing protein [Mucilaginibacter terrenus]RFZ82801.1 DUF4153 domain-containing protein [Mucilaginibacter terrenus]
MKFPSIKSLAQSALATIKRFPLEIVFALAGTIACTVKIESDTYYGPLYNWCTRLMMMANLGVLLCLSATLYIQSRQMSSVQKLALRFGAVAVSILLLFALDPFGSSSNVIRFFIFSLAFHLLVAFAAYTGRGHIQGFWQFNKTLFLRFLTSALYSGVLFLGIAAAIGSVHFLFNIETTGKIFEEVFTWIAGIFNTLFFLSGIPEDTKALDADESYPKGLKVFTQYVLIPLATLYVAILLAYEVKIIALWMLPKGLVSSLILGYAVFGILSILLVYPVREKAENTWLKTYAKSFYFLLIPLLSLLFTAAGARIFTYGITEMRYFLLALGVWLVGVTAYFLISKKQNIKLIPISLCILALLATYGPQSAFSVSKYSQRERMVRLFEKNKLVKDNVLMPFDSTRANKDDGEKAAAILSYLVEKHDLTSLQPYFKEPLSIITDSLEKTTQKDSHDYLSRYELRSKKTVWALKRLGLKKYAGYYPYVTDTAEKEERYEFTIESRNTVFTKGYDLAIMHDYYTVDTTVHVVNDVSIRQVLEKEDVFSLKLNSDLVQFDMRKLLAQTLPQAIRAAKSKERLDPQIIPDNLLTFKSTSANYEVTFKISFVSFSKQGNDIDVSNLDGVYLVKKRP